VRSLFRLLPFAIVIGGAAACGGSDATGPESRAKRMTVLTGDAQSGPTGATLPIALAVEVLASDVPIVGATVNWRVVSGAATLSATSSKTDSTGTASTTVTLGTTIGPVVVSGSSGSAPSVSFNLSAIDPCKFATQYTIGSTVNGALSSGDCLQTVGNSQFYYDYYDFTATNQLGITAQMSSSSFDTWLDFFGGPDTSSLEYLAFSNDAAQGNTNSVIQLILAPGAYELGANSNLPKATGSYTLSTSIRAQAIAGCQVVWVSRGISVNDSITSGDCKTDFERDSTYGDAAVMLLRAGTAVHLTEHSTAFNAQLKLYRGDSLFLLPPVARDSGEGGSDAAIDYIVPASNAFVIFIGATVPHQTGTYTLTISPSATAAGTRSRPEPLRLPPFPSRWPLVAAHKNSL
jgi:hypothetical protein